MNDSINIPVWFYIAASLAVTWESMGLFAYVSTIMISAEDMIKMTEAEQNIHKATPAWANGVFAIAVFSGFIGSLLLLLKKAWALPVLIISLLAILVQMYNAFFIMDSFAVFGPGGTIMPIMVIVIAILLIGLAQSAKSKQWIK